MERLIEACRALEGAEGAWALFCLEDPAGWAGSLAGHTRIGRDMPFLLASASLPPPTPTPSL